MTKPITIKELDERIAFLENLMKEGNIDVKFTGIVSYNILKEWKANKIATLEAIDKVINDLPNKIKSMVLQFECAIGVGGVITINTNIDKIFQELQNYKEQLGGGEK
jgi:hypothetical protein